MKDPEKIKQLDFLLRKVYAYSYLVFHHGMHKPQNFLDFWYMSKLLNLSNAWFNHLLHVNQIARTNIVIPIIDLGLGHGFALLYSLYTDTHHHFMVLNVSGRAKTCESENFCNIIEPVFSKDEYSIGVQMADLVGVLRLNNSLLHPADRISQFHEDSIKVVKKYIKRKKTVCMFQTYGYDPDTNKNYVNYHDSYSAGKLYEERCRPSRAGLSQLSYPGVSLRLTPGYRISPLQGFYTVWRRKRHISGNDT